MTISENENLAKIGVLERLSTEQASTFGEFYFMYFTPTYIEKVSYRRLVYIKNEMDEVVGALHEELFDELFKCGYHINYDGLLVCNKFIHVNEETRLTYVDAMIQLIYSHKIVDNIYTLSRVIWLMNELQMKTEYLNKIRIDCGLPFIHVLCIWLSNGKVFNNKISTDDMFKLDNLKLMTSIQDVIEDIGTELPGFFENYIACIMKFFNRIH